MVPSVEDALQVPRPPMSAGFVASVATGPTTAKVVTAVEVMIDVVEGVQAQEVAAVAALPLVVNITDAAEAALVKMEKVMEDLKSSVKDAASCATRRVTSSAIALKPAAVDAQVVIDATTTVVAIVINTTGARLRAAAPLSIAVGAATT